MPKISILKPADQPTGATRLLDELKNNLDNSDFDCFKFIVAYAKLGPLARLDPYIQKWRAGGKKIKAIFGIDQQGSSKEALEYALDNFSETYIAHQLGIFSPTFHPKIYLFTGADVAVSYVGSNNLTVGGTETNFESYIKLELDLESDSEIFDEVNSCWTETKTKVLQLDKKLLAQLVINKLVVDEQTKRNLTKKAVQKTIKTGSKSLALPKFPSFNLVPASPLPKGSLVQKTKPKITSKSTGTATSTKTGTPASFTASILVIQIVPHHNGEVFLSKTAIDQNQSFFGWPFTGFTTPKKASNSSYPQRTPDPIVNITVYGPTGNVVIKHDNYDLNTVYYDKKSEIRITVPQDVVTEASAYSNAPYAVMVMSEFSAKQQCDYCLDIYLPGSSDYTKYVAACNQTMPSGGKPNPRKFGWI